MKGFGFFVCVYFFFLPSPFEEEKRLKDICKIHKGSVSWQKSSSSAEEHRHGPSSRMFLILRDKGRICGGRGLILMFLPASFFNEKKQLKQQFCFAALFFCFGTSDL